MSKEEYRETIDYICKGLNIEPWGGMYENCNLDIDGIAFTITHGSVEELADIVFICCDFGEPPAIIHSLVWRRVLEANVVTFGITAPIFGLNPTNGHLLLMHRLFLSKQSAEAVLRTLMDLTAYVRRSRSTFFGPPTEKELAALPIQTLAA